MSTLLSTFREPVRVLIGDNDPDIQLREDAQIDAALRTVLNLGKVVGDQTTVTSYLPDTLGTSVTPTLTPALDPKGYAELVYHTARVFIADDRPTSWRTRAFSESVGNNVEKIWLILEELWGINFGDGSQSSDYDDE
jgi:hypothetical protein